jgi:hypothetical protein
VPIAPASTATRVGAAAASEDDVGAGDATGMAADVVGAALEWTAEAGWLGALGRDGSAHDAVAATTASESRRVAALRMREVIAPVASRTTRAW